MHRLGETRCGGELAGCGRRDLRNRGRQQRTGSGRGSGRTPFPEPGQSRAEKTAVIHFSRMTECFDNTPFTIKEQTVQPTAQKNNHRCHHGPATEVSAAYRQGGNKRPSGRDGTGTAAGPNAIDREATLHIDGGTGSGLGVGRLDACLW
ncbi:uncharacterized protein VDAG_09162 [Verticillium dahliae VdLs.17]|uniref:Uncharacterized protein n=1 Tax=Verticillium dahliae (strain VdLs.17 / ATCC MYA-4575 / FGSC 10137) TaxID=498257 RepID=G2XFN8_VERDV|nr:uncharacterized protein VDAG_09162 [Verticillium dahliae VdLs.17]EGY18636.1 hypothetical protein VDAG_09162 [Verticillium dahliae VdLs.17]